MNGSGYLLAAVLMLYGVSLLTLRFVQRGPLYVLRQPITLFYGSWILGLLLLSLPLFSYREEVSLEFFGYVMGALAAFTCGAVAAVFFGNSLRLEARQFGVLTPEEDYARLQRLVQLMLVAGLVGSALMFANTLLSGTLGLAERFDGENAAQIRAEHMTLQESQIGRLYGPASFASAIGGLGVAYVLYFLGRDPRLVPKFTRWLCWLVMIFNGIIAFVAFGSRMFAVFFLLIAFLAFCFGRWSAGRRVLAYKFTFKRIMVAALSTLSVLIALWLAATYFLEKRVGGQSAQSLLYSTHRADFADPLYEVIRHDEPLKYFAFSVSYFTTPIPTLAYYVDLPAERSPGPFWGQYNFPPVARWLRRLTFNADPFFWERARLEIFRPLGDFNHGTNVWSTSLRDLIADFGKLGSIAFVGVVAFLTQLLLASFGREPTAVKAGLLAYVSMFLLFSGLVSALFMPQIHWPLYLSIILLATGFNRQRKKNLVQKLGPWRDAPRPQAPASAS